ncbi:MAG: hypothetical protein RLZZ181_912, partial [Pseudomonadota bacterium]
SGAVHVRVTPEDVIVDVADGVNEVMGYGNVVTITVFVCPVVVSAPVESLGYKMKDTFLCTPLVFTTKKPCESSSCTEIEVFVSHGNNVPSAFFTFIPGTQGTTRDDPTESCAFHSREMSCPLEIAEGESVYDTRDGAADAT